MSGPDWERDLAAMLQDRADTVVVAADPDADLGAAVARRRRPKLLAAGAASVAAVVVVAGIGVGLLDRERPGSGVSSAGAPVAEVPRGAASSSQDASPQQAYAIVEAGSGRNLVRLEPDGSVTVLVDGATGEKPTHVFPSVGGGVVVAVQRKGAASELRRFTGAATGPQDAVTLGEGEWFAESPDSATIVTARALDASDNSAVRDGVLIQVTGGGGTAQTARPVSRDELGGGEVEGITWLNDAAAATVVLTTCDDRGCAYVPYDVASAELRSPGTSPSPSVGSSGGTKWGRWVAVNRNGITNVARQERNGAVAVVEVDDPSHPVYVAGDFTPLASSEAGLLLLGPGGTGLYLWDYTTGRAPVAVRGAGGAVDATWG